MEMVLTGEPRAAEEMHRLGLVNRLVEPGHALDAALELADQLGKNSPIAVRAAKEIVARSYAEQWTDADGWKLQMGPFERVQGSEDLREGLAAFAEKREPVWKGR